MDQNVVAGKGEDARQKKGAAVLDQYLPLHGDEVYYAMLNQTNLGENTNKFHMIQALESNDGGEFMVYNRWGRVGTKGRDNIQGPYTLRDGAIGEFERKFFVKTNNRWSERKNFICHPKYYTWLEMDHSMDNKSDVQENPISRVETQLRITKLEPRIANFISLICNNSRMMKQHVMGLGYKAEKLPLGKLSKSTILKGYDVLKRIADVIGQSDKKMLEQLAGEFYTVIPHDFGLRKMSKLPLPPPPPPPPLSLSHTHIHTHFLNFRELLVRNPLYSHYQCLRCELTPVEVHTEEFSMILKYMRNTDTSTHYSTDIVHIFRTSRENENERFKEFSRTKNRMLLWHGSRLENWTGILSQGLRIAPPEAPASGSSFGKGVYFADVFSNSAGYCGENCAAKDRVLVLCEVALGDMNEHLSYNDNANKLPKGMLSTKAVGKIAPDLSEAQVLEDGVIVPHGKLKEQQERKGVLQHNEYIVYNVDQIRIRYVVHVNVSYTLTGDSGVVEDLALILAAYDFKLTSTSTSQTAVDTRNSSNLKDK
ncbi:hypothetical protein L1049_005426 [Liquidambar formosana]|uniref:Poly [ADP-ribose] polymerase n=1 Tax=Liquidambar formosana TaxID=63359 RepID=A0AAP0WZ81_LIQFO